METQGNRTGEVAVSLLAMLNEDVSQFRVCVTVHGCYLCVFVCLCVCLMYVG